jgi:hypothetical protein
MPPRASPRLTAYVLGPSEGASAAAVLAALAGAGARAIVEGGADWSAHDAPVERFFANGQGGFRVSCPACGAVATAGFPRALEAWRGGGPRAFGCACGVETDLAALVYAPDAGFAARWLRGADAGSIDLLADARGVIARHWPDFRVIGSRG